MRINKYVAAALGIGRRQADKLIDNGAILVNNLAVQQGHMITPDDVVTCKGEVLQLPYQTVTIALHKPVGYVCSRNGQGSKTIYDLLPQTYQHLNPAGRLDKDSSGLLILSSDGELLEQLTHPRYKKQKIYRVTLGRPLDPVAIKDLKKGVKLDDGTSTFDAFKQLKNHTYEVVLHEGRNRQIRRTFGALKYKVEKLHRTHFGPYTLSDLPEGQYKEVK